MYIREKLSTVGSGCISAEGVKPPANEFYDTKQTDGKAPALEIWRIQNTSSLLLLPNPH